MWSIVSRITIEACVTSFTYQKNLILIVLCSSSRPHLKQLIPTITNGAVLIRVPEHDSPPEFRIAKGKLNCRSFCSKTATRFSGVNWYCKRTRLGVLCLSDVCRQAFRQIYFEIVWGRAMRRGWRCLYKKIVFSVAKLFIQFIILSDFVDCWT